jgi:peptidoglycan-associated lipoprotein
MVRSGWKYIIVIGAALAISGCTKKDDIAASTGDATTSQASTAGSSAQAPGPVPGTVQDFTVNVGDRIFFATDSYNLDGAAQSTLGLQAQWLRQNAGAMIVVEGHADERGTREYNIALGGRRANSVRNYLIAQGIDHSRVRTISYGKERPEKICSNESCWRVNRRGVTTLSGVPTS